jgi:hypothetical protein
VQRLVNFYGIFYNSVRNAGNITLNSAIVTTILSHWCMRENLCWICDNLLPLHLSVIHISVQKLLIYTCFVITYQRDLIYLLFCHHFVVTSNWQEIEYWLKLWFFQDNVVHKLQNKIISLWIRKLITSWLWWCKSPKWFLFIINLLPTVTHQCNMFKSQLICCQIYATDFYMGVKLGLVPSRNGTNWECLRKEYWAVTQGYRRLCNREPHNFSLRQILLGLSVQESYDGQDK